jgi:soluble lytic murein transglycosylase-like protein
MLRGGVTAASLAVLVAVVASGGGQALADIYSYTDASGVVHFTNIKPRGKGSNRWKRVTDEAAVGKAAAQRGSCARCDTVPSRDRSSERFARFDGFIHEASMLYAIPVPLIRAVIRVESDYDPRVVSSMGARGLMQLMPAVLRDMGVQNAHDPRENILGGTRLLRILANRYQGDLVRTIAAYHAGPGSLARYGDNVPPYPNTRKYLRMVVDRYYQYVAEERRMRVAAD